MASELRAYHPGIAERTRNWVADTVLGGIFGMEPRDASTYARERLDYFPIIDAPLGLLQVAEDLQKGNYVSGLLGSAMAAVPILPAAAKKAVKQTVTDPTRLSYPGVYKDPVEIAEEAAARTVEESPALKDLFGVTRQDLYDISRSRVGNVPPQIATKSGARGSAAARKIMNPTNEQRVMDVIYEGEKRAPELMKGMGGWYVMDPAYERLVQISDDPARRFETMNAFQAASSPMTTPTTELNRGSAAYMAHEMGRLDDWLRYGGNPTANIKALGPEFAAAKGHPAHSTSISPVIQRYADTGAVTTSTPKVPLYEQSSRVPEIGFQTDLPVPDAHFGRAVGLPDARGGGGLQGHSIKMPEYQDIGPWFASNIAAPTGRTSVQGQGQIWGLFAPQTGVDAPVGAPKLEMFADKITERAADLGVDPRWLRDEILMGRNIPKMLAPLAPAGLLGAGLLGSDEEGAPLL